MLDLYKRIKSRREELGISQEELSRRLNYKSRSSINKVEKGINDIPQSKIKDFATALNTTPEYLMGWTNIPDISASENTTLSEDENKELQKILWHLPTKEEQDLLESIRGMTEDQQNIIKNMVHHFDKENDKS